MPLPVIFARVRNTYPMTSFIFYALALTMLCSCASQYNKEPSSLVVLPKTWQSYQGDYRATLNWSELIQSQALRKVIDRALKHNQNLAQKALDVDIARTSVFQSNMAYIPELDASYTARRVASEALDEQVTISNQFSLSADLSYELNLWGQISDERKSAIFSYNAVRFDYEQTLRSLVRQVAELWATVIEAQQLVDLRSARLESLDKNLNIIESGYRSGLNSALEVYLARNDVESERSQLIQAQQTLSDANRSLHLLLGEYPSNTLAIVDQFPHTSLILPPELPSELLMRRPDLQAAWLRILAQNANVAIAYKSRFPSIRLNGSIGYDSDSQSTLLDGPLEWSVAANLLQPILSAGRLKAAEKNARIALEQSELAYNAAVFSAFQEVESGLEKQKTLQQRYTTTQQSRDNALQAEKLSFEQYLKGIVSYTTVLDSQRRALDAEIQLIALQKQIFINKVTLHEALAGGLDFDNVNIPKDS